MINQQIIRKNNLSTESSNTNTLIYDKGRVNQHLKTCFGEVQSKIVNELEQSKIFLQSKKEFFSKKIKKDITEKRIMQLQLMKKNIKQTLQSIKFDEMEYKNQLKSIQQAQRKQVFKKNRLSTENNDSPQNIHNISNHSLTYTNSSLRSKSQLMLRNEHNIKGLKQKLDNFDLKLLEKTKKFKAQIQQYKESQRHQKMQAIKQLMQRNKARSLKNLEELAKKRVQWQQKQKEKTSILTNKQKKDRLYQRLAKQFEEAAQEKERSISKQLKIRLDNRKRETNIRNLGEHERSYISYLKAMKKQRLQRLIQIKQTNEFIESKEHRHIQKSKFYEYCLYETEQQAIRLAEKMKQKYIFKQKLKDYGKMIREDLHAKIKMKKNESELKSSSLSNIKQMRKQQIGYEEMKEMGNKFMRHGSLFIDRKKLNHDLQINNKATSVEEKKYINYLPQLHSRISKIKRKVFWLQEKKLKQIVESHKSQREKVEQLNKILKQVEGKQTAKDDLTLDKIEMKIKILDTATKLIQ